METEHGLDSEAPANERAGNRQAQPKPPRHISTLPVMDGERCAVKAGAFQWETTHPGTGSFHPVTTEAAVEVTKLLEPSVQRVVLATL